MKKLLPLLIILFFSNCHPEPEKCCGSDDDMYKIMHDSVAAVKADSLAQQQKRKEKQDTIKE